MADYPGILPVFSIDGHGYADKATMQRMDMDAGPARNRKTVRRAGTLFNVRAIYTQSQMALFEGWFVHVIGNGSGWFNAGLDVGRGLVTQSALFYGASYKTSRNGRYFVVDATLLVKARAILTEAEYTAEMEA